MKPTYQIYPLALALAVTMAGAGCKHEGVKTTPLPPPPVATAIPDTQQLPPANQPPQPQPQPQPQPEPAKDLPLAPVVPVDMGASSTNISAGPIAENPDWQPGDYLADRAALEASTVHFAFDSAVVRMSEEVNIKAVVTYLNGNPHDKLMVEGNCDERGTEEYNRSLGERRALALREALARQGIASQRVRTISFGKDKPVDPAHNESAFAKNRRGDFVVYHPKTGNVQ